MPETICEVHSLGLVDYQTAWDMQNRLAGEIGRGERPPILLFLEHFPVYTFGRRGQVKNLLWDAAELERRGIRVVWTDRGGDVTYHGPGQLVGYPLLPLGQPGHSQPAGRIPQADYVGYLRRLEETLLRGLAALGVTAYRRDGLTGVWMHCAPPNIWGKVAAIGVKVDAQGVTRHGFALNVNPAMDHWEGIIACGLVDERPTSLAELLANPPPMQQVKQAVARAFGSVFGFAMRGNTAEESLENQDSV